MKYRKILKFMQNPLGFIFGKKHEPEVIDCFWQKLPHAIEVQWFRDGKFIIGEVKADGYKFMTQGKNAKEFIEMVNDALFSIYEIPNDYFDIFLKHRKFEPDSYQKSLLENKDIMSSVFNVQKIELARV